MEPGEVRKAQRCSLSTQTYPQPVHEGHDFGCDFPGVLLPDGVQDDIGQEEVALPGIEYLLMGESEAKENGVCKKHINKTIRIKGCSCSIPVSSRGLL